MKLNLLPNTVSKQRQAKTAWAIFTLIVLISVMGAAALSLISSAGDKAAQQAAEEFKQPAADAYAISQQADEVVAKAAGVVKNTSLAEAMISHNEVYPRLYEDVRPYIPPFFRVTSMIATPVDGTTAQLQLNGVLDTYQQYADLVLALMRFKDAKSIQRAGYQVADKIVPNISAQDQVGTPHKPGEAVVPSDPLERLAYYQSLGNTGSGYLGVGNFGAPVIGTKGAMPGYEAITVTMLVNRNLQVPSVEQTLGSGAAAGGGFGGPGGPGGFGGAPGGPGGFGPAGPAGPGGFGGGPARFAGAPGAGGK